MVIRPMAAVYVLGEIGRSAAGMGAKGGPTAFLSGIKDEVSLGRKSPANAGLYTAAPLFKIMGAVELMSEEPGALDESLDFGDNPILL